MTTVSPTSNELPNFDLALCKGEPTDWWYPATPPTRENLSNAIAAKRICRDCSIQEQCLAYSLKWEPVGIWGGYTESERHSLRKQYNIVSARPTGGVRTARKIVEVKK